MLIFAEVMPKTYAIHNAEKVALAVAPVMHWVVLLFSPVTGAVRILVTLMLRALGAAPAGGNTPSEEELRGAIELHKRRGRPGEATSTRCSTASSISPMSRSARS